MKLSGGFTIAVASGKGGTGKTTVAVSLARVIKDVTLLDCDVEEPNAHLFLKPDIRETRPVKVPVPEVDEEACSFCGTCADVCAFHAILVGKNTVLTFPELCHSCGGCALLCPDEAITEVQREMGVVEIGAADGIDFVHGILNVGEPMPVPVISAVKKLGNPDGVNIIDSPPGTSCPMVEAVRDADFLLLVTEPTPFGLNDLKIAIETARLLNLPHAVVINRAGLGDDRVRDYCRDEKIELLAEIPNDRRAANAYSRGEVLVDEIEELRNPFRSLADNILKMRNLKKDSPGKT